MTQGFMQRGENGQLPIFFQYLYNLGVLLSQSISTLLGGDPQETLSSRTGKAILGGNLFAKNYLGPLMDFIFREKDHAINSIQEDEGKKEIWRWSNYYVEFHLEDFEDE